MRTIEDTIGCGIAVLIVSALVVAAITLVLLLVRVVVWAF